MSTLPVGSTRSGVPVPVDEKTHPECPSCTWAPPASPTNFESNYTNFTGHTMDSPVQEHLPPLYDLPNRSSHIYEDECKTHQGPGARQAHHCQGAPRKAEVEPKPFNHQRTKSWSMEDQKRLMHMKLLNTVEETK